MEDIANEYVAFLDYLGFGKGVELIAKENGGFFVHRGLLYPDNKDKTVRELSEYIVDKLKNPKSRVPLLREKFEKLKEESYYLGGSELYDWRGTKQSRFSKTEAGFKEYLEDYYEKDDASSISTGTSQGSSVDELTHKIERIDLSPPSVTVEEQRQLAMKRPFIEEKVADFSDVFHTGGGAPKKNFEGMLPATGMAEHMMYGEKHYKAKLTPKDVNEIRTRYFAGEKTVNLHKEYKVALGTIDHIIGRHTWKHLPQVPGEPDEYLARPNQQEVKVIKIAKQYGVEPVRNKIGRLALPPELIKQLRKERAEKKVEKEMKALK